MQTAQLLEAMMVISFGISWPVSISKSIRSRTAKGKSGFFLVMIFIGYICGILSKVAMDTLSYVVVFYVLNLVMVGIDLLLFVRNRRLDRGGA